jgi:hypothetical protein
MIADFLNYILDTKGYEECRGFVCRIEGNRKLANRIFRRFFQYESIIIIGCVLYPFLLFSVGLSLRTLYQKVIDFPDPSRDATTSPWPGMIKLFPAKESLVSDIPARDGKH